MNRLGLCLLFVAAATLPPLLAQEGDGKLRVIAFAAHPDDCDGRPAAWPPSTPLLATT